jgi:kumamolisin
LRDITEGDNEVNQVSGYKAKAGWDPCTGLGSPNGANLLAFTLILHQLFD